MLSAQVSDNLPFLASQTRAMPVAFPQSSPDHFLSLGHLSSQHRSEMEAAATADGVWRRERHGDGKQDHWLPACPGVDWEGRAQSGFPATFLVLRTSEAREGGSPDPPPTLSSPKPLPKPLHSSSFWQGLL